ncbi:MAG: long-chain fatty acid--CoA ligase [Actinomycetota bacterium]|nr:long-chain fatty acid--CoA ligase [Actinomycetota bacterium]
MGSLLLWDTFDAATASHPERTAIRAGTHDITFRDLAAHVVAAAAALGDAGVARGARVVLLAYDEPTTLAWLFAAFRQGASVAVMMPASSETAAQLALLDPTVVVACRAGDDRIVHFGGAHGPALPPGLVVFTAGTTGLAKGVVHTHETLGASVRILQLLRVEAMFGVAGGTVDETKLATDLGVVARSVPLGLVYGTTMPLTTIAGITVALQALLAGDQLVPLAPARPVRLLRSVHDDALTNVSLYPLLAQRLVRELHAHPIDTPANLMFVGIGGGPVPESVAAALEASLGCAVAVGYGATEAGGAITMGRITDHASTRHGTIGTPLPGIEVTIDSESSELLVRTPARCVGCIDAVGVTPPVEHDGWYRTGDLARTAPGGAYTVHGRVDALIRRGGRRIDPVSVEHALERHPDVDQAAVFAVASRAVAGEDDVWSLVVARGPLEEGGVRRHCSELLGPEATPRRVIVVPSLPRTADGSVRRHQLESVARLALERQ